MFEREEALYQQLSREKLITSSGGFRDVLEYQVEAMRGYLEDQKDYLENPTGLYNSTGNARGYPDVAVNVVNYLTAVDGKSPRSMGLRGRYWSLPSEISFFYDVIIIYIFFSYVKGKKSQLLLWSMTLG